MAAIIDSFSTALVRTIPETFKGLGLSQQLAFGSTKAMLARMIHALLFSINGHSVRIDIYPD